MLANAHETAAGRKFADGAAMRPDPARLPELDRLGDQIAELSARIDAATCELLCHLREFDRGYGWEGFRSCAHWLNWRTGLDLGAAREKLRVATALADLNHVSAAMARGQLSYSKVRALTRVATPATEARLLAVALRSTAAHVERLVRAWRRADCDAAPDAERERLASRALSMQVDEDGMVVLRGRLTPEVGAVLLRAVEAAAEQVPASETGEASETGDETTIAQRRADALGLVAESALAGGLDPGNSADRFQVTVHVQAGTLPSREPANEARRVSAETRTGSPAPSEPPTTAADAAPHVAAETWETRPAESVPIGPAGNGAHPDGNTMPGVASEAGRSLGYTRSRDSRSERPAIVAPDADLDADLDASRHRTVGWAPRGQGGGPSRGLRCRPRGAAARRRRRGTGRRAQDAYGPERPAPRPAEPGPRPVPVPGLRVAPQRNRCTGIVRRRLFRTRHGNEGQRERIDDGFIRLAFNAASHLDRLAVRGRFIVFTQPNSCRLSVSIKGGVELLDHVGVVAHALHVQDIVRIRVRMPDARESRCQPVWPPAVRGQPAHVDERVLERVPSLGNLARRPGGQAVVQQHRHDQRRFVLDVARSAQIFGQ